MLNLIRLTVRVLNPFRQDTVDDVKAATGRLFERADRVHAEHLERKVGTERALDALVSRYGEISSETDRARTIRARISSLLD